MDIFSSFDDQNFTFLSLAPLIWIFGLIPIVLVQSSYWVGSARFGNFVFFLKSFMYGQVGRTMGSRISGFGIMVVSIFVFLIMINLFGLFPYVFSLSSHLSFAFCFGLPFWFSLILSGFFFNYYDVIGHFLPSGAPSVLNPFLVLVESVSIMVRPVTLSVRLSANMSAGHIILGLLGSYLSSGIFSYSWLVLVVLVVVQIFYSVFEVGIGLIQAYIFSLLISLYSEDHPS
uniref:ATP synthase F0 subunit 6 n=1 Tax=Acanthochitona mahensis TaxID=1231393 RepID=UPI00286BFC24|nr:ATP synthase F0 subunit 6 [Acanthochitona mahensis]WLW42185.1 ATP synthase F0 subunit 6 [Acanthochitona mahensis]